MEIKVNDNIIEIWQTGMKDNQLLYSSFEQNLCIYTRRDLSNYEDFLMKEGFELESIKINKFLGRNLKYRTIPKLIPVGNYNVDIPLDFLKNKIESFVNEDRLQLNPDFQRPHVWSMNQRIKFIEFLLQGGKCPTIYFNHEGWMRSFDGEFVIVDGKQRLTSLLMFLDNKIRVFKEQDSEGLGFLCNEIDNVGRIYINYTVNSLSSREKVLEWYLQMNRGQIQHTEEELNKVEDMLNKIKEVDKND